MVSLIKSVFTGFQKFRQDQLQMAEVLRKGKLMLHPILFDFSDSAANE